MRKVPVAMPYLDDSETNFVNREMQAGAISGLFGDSLVNFEQGFARFCETEYAVTCSSGTGALHLAMHSLDLGPGDEVLVSTLTNMATFFAVQYVGAKPIPVDIESSSWNMDSSLLEGLITPKTKAIVVVHLFGHPVDMGAIMEVAIKYDLRVVEDCAQAHGATYNGKKVGSIGDVGCFSFYANKVITTGEGGMCTTNSAKIASRIKSAKALSFGGTNKFLHEELGYNYRMTNIQAAIGCAQLEKLEKIIDLKRQIAARYTAELSQYEDLVLPIEKPYAKCVYWMYHIGLRGKWSDLRPVIMGALGDFGVDTREGFVPYSLQNYMGENEFVNSCPRANASAYSTFYLPSGTGLSKDDQQYVIDRLHEVLSAF